MSSIEAKFSSGWVSIKDVVENNILNVFFEFFEDYYAVYRGNKLLCYKKKTNFEKKELPLVTYDLTSVTFTTITYDRNALYQIDVRLPGRTEPITVRAHLETLRRLLNTIPTHPELKQAPAGQLSDTDYPPLMKPETSQVECNSLTQEEQRVLKWCQDLLATYEWKVFTFGKDWKDGRLLQAIMSILKPEVITLDETLAPEEALRQSVDVAVDAFDMEGKFDYIVNDFRKGNSTFIFYFLKYLHDCVHYQKEREEREKAETQRIEEEILVLEWCQNLTLKYGVYIANFGSSWRDGKALLAFIEALRPGTIDLEQIPSYEALNTALQIGKQAFALEDFYSAYDFKKGVEDKVFNFVKSIYSSYHKQVERVPEVVPPREPHLDVLQKIEEMSEEEKIVLRWCQKQTAEYETIHITNFDESWKDGLAVNALMHSLRPEFIDMQHVESQQKYDRITDALDAIYQVFRIQIRINVDDMENGNKGQIFKLVNSLYEHHKLIFGHMDVLTSDEEAVEPENAPKVIENCAKQRVPCPEGMERCENCGFDRKTAELGKEYFKCLECKIIYCRTCKIDQFDHLNKNCEEAGEEKARRQFIDDGIIAAFIRQCHKCGIRFGKDGGCNNMQCRCGGTQCYLCRAPDVEYNHFCSHEINAKTGECFYNCGRNCPLNSNQDEVDRAEKIRKRAQLEEEYKRLHPRREKM